MKHIEECIEKFTGRTDVGIYLVTISDSCFIALVMIDVDGYFCLSK